MRRNFVFRLLDVYFNQLLGAACNQKQVEILVSGIFKLFCWFWMFSSDLFLKTREKVWNTLFLATHWSWLTPKHFWTHWEGYKNFNFSVHFFGLTGNSFFRLFLLADKTSQKHLYQQKKVENGKKSILTTFECMQLLKAGWNTQHLELGKEVPGNVHPPPAHPHILLTLGHITYFPGNHLGSAITHVDNNSKYVMAE